MRKKPKQKRSIILKILILGLSVYMIASLTSLASTLNKNQQELEDLKLLYQNEQQSIEELKEMLKDESNNKQIIEKAARERLGYIYSDEQIFIDISGN